MNVRWFWICIMIVNVVFSELEVFDFPTFLILTYLSTILCVQLLSRDTHEVRTEDV